MTWFFFEKQNRELRTVPTGLGGMRIADLTWDQDWSGQQIKPGDRLAVVTFSGGVSPQVFLTAPPDCDGVVAQTFDLDKTGQALAPSQLLLFLK